MIGSSYWLSGLCWVTGATIMLVVYGLASYLVAIERTEEGLSPRGSRLRALLGGSRFGRFMLVGFAFVCLGQALGPGRAWQRPIWILSAGTALSLALRACWVSRRGVR